MTRSVNVKVYFLILALVWSLFVVSIMVCGIAQEQRNMVDNAIHLAREHFTLDQALLMWAASYESVYVTDDGRLSVRSVPAEGHEPGRGALPCRHLTRTSPGNIYQEIMGQYAVRNSLRSHITSLRPHREENAPGEWERNALESFTRGRQEAYTLSKIDGTSYLFYMKPLFAGKTCLNCHHGQGIGEGAVLGGVVISMPLRELSENLQSDTSRWVVSFVAVWLVGVGFLKVIRDITLRRQAEREKKLNEERLGILLRLNEMVDDSIEHVIQFGLEECVRLTGSSIGYFHFLDEKQRCLDLVTWSRGVRDNCAAREKMKYPLREAGIWTDCIRSGKPVIHNEYQNEPHRKGYPAGHIHIERHMGIPVFEQDEIVAIIGVGNKEASYTEFDIRQVTLLAQGMNRLVQRRNALQEKELLESQLRQAQKMEAIGTLAGGIAHDFNNILAIIYANADMAMEDIPEGSPAGKNVKQIVRASDRARDLVKQILTFSRQSEQKPVPLDPCRIIKESLKLLRATIPSTVRIVSSVSSECGTIMADPTQFQRVLINLFANASDAMDEKGTLELCGTAVTLGEGDIPWQHDDMRPGAYFRLSVGDTGRGMDESTVERIFDPFFTTKEVGAGTGMGLSIVMGIVRSCGGMIKVESRPDRGTVFHVYFPIIDAGRTADRLSAGEPRKGTERILFVDDEEMIAATMSTILVRQGYGVTVRTNSPDALLEFRARPDEYDLVITDQTMPGLSGLELSAEILRIRSDIPILLTTGYSRKISEETVLETGIRGIVYKPYDRTRLLDGIAMVLGAGSGKN